MKFLGYPTSSKFKNAKSGDLFSQASTVAKPLVLRFECLVPVEELTGDETFIDGTKKGNAIFGVEAAMFTVAQTGEVVFCDGDDRFGSVPKVDAGRRARIADRIQGLKEELARYEYLNDQLERYDA